LNLKGERGERLETQYIIKVIKLRRVKLAGIVARMGQMRNTYSILVGNPERKRPLGRYGRR
jgi:hypothetical protein